MSVVGGILRATGLYDRLRAHFIDALLVPVATDVQIGPREARLLGTLVRGLDPTRPIIELGTLFGHSARVIIENKDDSQELITVDNYGWNPCGVPIEQHRHITRRLLANAVRDARVKVLDMDKDVFYEGYDGPAPAMVFLDADHRYEETLTDIDWALSVGSHLICGHDYGDSHPGVVRAVEARGGASELVDSLWVLET